MLNIEDLDSISEELMYPQPTAPRQASDAGNSDDGRCQAMDGSSLATSLPQE